jgi:hypothetical protein
VPRLLRRPAVGAHGRNLGEAAIVGRHRVRVSSVPRQTVSSRAAAITCSRGAAGAAVLQRQHFLRNAAGAARPCRRQKERPCEQGLRVTVVERRRIAPNSAAMYPRALSDKDLASFSQPFDVGEDNKLEFITRSCPTLLRAQQQPTRRMVFTGRDAPCNPALYNDQAGRSWQPASRSRTLQEVNDLTRRLGARVGWFLARVHCMELGA